MKKILTLTIGILVLGLYIIFFLIHDHPDFKNQKAEPIQEQVSNKKKLSKRAKIRGRAKHEFDKTHDPALGYIPSERLWEAQQYADRLSAEQPSSRGAIANVSWTSRGPLNVGGRTRALMFDPTDPNKKRVFAGGVSGGLWKNNDITNPASAWVKVNDFMDKLSVTALAYDPKVPTTWYLGTGEAWMLSTRGVGLYKSTDAGTTWTHMSNTNPAMPGTGPYNFRFVNDLVVRDEGAKSVLYVAVKAKFMGEDEVQPPGDPWMGDEGLFRSDNGGATFKQVLDSINGNPRAPTDIEIGPDTTIWVGTGRNSSLDGGGAIYYCTSGCDQKINWMVSHPADGADRVQIGISESSVDTLYAVAANPNPAVREQDCLWLKRSIDGGVSWGNLNIPVETDPYTNCNPTAFHFTRGQANFDLCIAVKPTDARVVLLGGIDLYRSTNGTSFNLISSWGNGKKGALSCDAYIHADQHIITFLPTDPDAVAIGNDGGVFYSPNAGAHGADPAFGHRVKNFNVTQYYSCDINPTATTHIYLGGTQDNGSHFLDNSTNAIEVGPGDGGFCYIDQNDTAIQIVSYINNYYYFTRDAWANYDSVFDTDAGGNYRETGRFINPTDYDYIDSILYGAHDPDRFSRIASIGNAMGSYNIEVITSGLGGQQASAFKVSPNDNHTLYIGTSNGGIYRLINAHTGVNVNAVAIGGAPKLPQGYVSSIDIEKGDDAHLLVTISNYGVNSVWETINGGNNWTSVEGNLPDIPIRWGVFSPLSADKAFIATEIGVWSTDNLNGTNTIWGPTNNGLANVRTDMIRFRHNDNTLRRAPASATLIVASHGRGLFTADISAFFPVEIISFDLATLSSSFRLNWVTTAESVTKGFQVQRRAAHETEFNQIDWVNAQEATTNTVEYVFDDKAIQPGITYYYRLNQIDQDGTSQYSQVLSGRIQLEEEWDVTIFPNPAGSQTNIRFTGPSNEAVSVLVFDHSGRTVMSKVFEGNPIVESLDVSTLGSGIYLLKASNGAQKMVKRLVVK